MNKISLPHQPASDILIDKPKNGHAEKIFDNSDQLSSLASSKLVRVSKHRKHRVLYVSDESVFCLLTTSCRAIARTKNVKKTENRSMKLPNQCKSEVATAASDSQSELIELDLNALHLQVTKQRKRKYRHVCDRSLLVDGGKCPVVKESKNSVVCDHSSTQVSVAPISPTEVHCDTEPPSRERVLPQKPADSCKSSSDINCDASNPSSLSSSLCPLDFNLGELKKGICRGVLGSRQTGRLFVCIH